MFVPEAVTYDHHSCLWLRKILLKLLVVPHQDSVLANRKGFIAAYHQHPKSHARINPITRPMQLEIWLLIFLKRIFALVIERRPLHIDNFCASAEDLFYSRND